MSAINPRSVTVQPSFFASFEEKYHIGRPGRNSGREWVKKFPTAASAAVIASVLAFASTAQAQDDSVLDLMRQQLETMQSQIDELRAKLEAAETHAAAAEASAKAAAATSAKAATDAAEAKSAEGDAHPIKVKWEPAPSISSPDGMFEMNLRGRIFADGGWASDGQNSMDVKGTELRAARLGIEGKAWKTVKYKFEADFGEDEVEVKDAYLEWSGPVAVTLGQFKTTNSLEEKTSSRFTTFMERASLTDAFGLARRIGLGIKKHGDDWLAEFGAYRGGNGVDNEDEGYELSGRLTYGPMIGSVQTHIGASFRQRSAGADQSNFRYRQRPHNHLSDRLIDTSSIATKDFMVGVEGAAVAGPLSAQSEFAWLKANVAEMNNDPTFKGGYFDVSYFLTGESRAYEPEKGEFGRPKVDNPVFSGGWGAWQIAARWDYIDLTDNGIFGGKQNTYIFGLNWYLNRNARLMINYSHSEIKQAFLVEANGPDGRNDADTLGIRAQVDW